MNETEFDSMLRESAPDVAIPDGLSDHRARILREARTRRTHRARKWAAGTALTAVLLGSGSAAMAGAGMETPWGWVADNVFSLEQRNAEICFAGMQVKFEGVSEDSEIVQDAREYVNSLDLEALDTTAMEERVQDENATATDESGNQRPIVLDGMELKQYALHAQVSKMLFAHLESLGYPQDPSPVSFYSRTTGCN